MPLSAHLATTSMISTIHVLKAKAKFDDDTYRDFLHKRTGKRSAKELTTSEAGRVIEDLRSTVGEAGIRGAIAGLDSPIGGKLRALWIAGHDLGIVRDRTDRAMLSFLERQTDVSHVRFLKDARAATSAIEGLKSWLERTAGVDWPTDRADVIANKRAVLDAQWRKLIAIGAVEAIGQAVDPMEGLQHYAGRIVRHNQWGTMEAHHYDEVQKALGNKLRGALARKSQQTGEQE
ncbi:regulatory protein GemA [Bradyrhizobium sp. BR 10289]|uniref:regulatory protein GemA n=1 Tax=Bradyrhizobium sp. BR 10289 TaxID=2749993 RepID=UPI001C64BC10|nr:regulatory protein GemA [Bradyrhizobium sp. BR 10289]MBW7968153.1 regulatory protein GemA [Bradyrhizobium sp. BR 10289]